MLTFLQETARVRSHLSRALDALARRDVGGLGVSRRAARASLIQDLVRYRARGLFPRNERGGRPTPTFVDSIGTPCALAHLIEASGNAGLVDRVARMHNHARVRELAEDAEFADWLDRHGFSAPEAALIQPAYCESAATCICSIDFPPRVLEGILVDGGLEVSAAHGLSGGPAIGSVVPLTSSYFPGTIGETWLAGWEYELAHPYFELLQPDTLDTSTCHSMFNSVAFPAMLSKDAFLAIASGEPCLQRLLADDPGWASSHTEGCPSGSSSSGGDTAGERLQSNDGCSATARTAPADAMHLILLALLFARRLRHRR